MQRKSDLKIEDIKVGDIVITTAPIHFYSHGVKIVEEGKFIKIKKIIRHFARTQTYHYYIVQFENMLPRSDRATWNQLKHKIIIKNKEWDYSKTQKH